MVGAEGLGTEIKQIKIRKIVQLCILRPGWKGPGGAAGGTGAGAYPRTAGEAPQKKGEKISHERELK